MKVREAMTQNLECVGPNDRVMAAQDLLLNKHVESVPVLDHNAIAGSLCNKDISETAARMGTNALHLSVHDAMSTDPFTVFDSDEVDDARQQMDEHKRQSVTVINSKNRIVGVLQRH